MPHPGDIHYEQSYQTALAENVQLMSHYPGTDNGFDDIQDDSPSQKCKPVGRSSKYLLMPMEKGTSTWEDNDKRKYAICMKKCHASFSSDKSA